MTVVGPAKDPRKTGKKKVSRRPDKKPTRKRGISGPSKKTSKNREKNSRLADLEKILISVFLVDYSQTQAKGFSPWADGRFSRPWVPQ
jgi:hypothetical protein